MLWSTVATAFKLSLRGVTYAQLLFYASITSTIVLFFIYSYQNGNIKAVFSPFNLSRSVLQGVLNPFLYYLVLFKAYSLLPAYEAQPLNYTWPFVISILSAIVLKQALSVSTVTGLIISFTGVIIISTRGDVFSMQFQNAEGVLLAVGSSLIWGVYWIISLKDKREATLKLLSSFIIGTLLSAVYLYFNEGFFVEQPVYILGAAYTGIFEMGITFFLWLKALTLSKNNARVASLAYLSPFLSLIFIYLILNEKITASAVTGLVLIISGILVQQLKPLREKKSDLSHSPQD